jgi:hypothetical protein
MDLDPNQQQKGQRCDEHDADAECFGQFNFLCEEIIILFHRKQPAQGADDLAVDRDRGRNAPSPLARSSIELHDRMPGLNLGPFL